MESSVKNSRAWEFIVASTILLLLFTINSLLLTHETGGTSANTLPLNTFLSFLLASATLTLCVLANVSAFMNQSSAKTTPILSPIILLIAFAVVAPFFVSLGLTLLN